MIHAAPGPGVAGSAFWQRPGLAGVLAALDGAGEEARVVGGAVRNSLLGLPVTDVDIATTALPPEATRRAVAAGFKVVPTGIAHGTVTVVAHGHPYEVTTLREDVETDGRRAVVRFGRDWRHDAARRDFTINALYARADGTVVDLVGGLADLAARRVRFIGDADARIREDYLRILRLFRFHAGYGAGSMDAAALAAAARGRAGLASLSRERVRVELLKTLMSPRAGETFAVMSDYGLVQPLLAGLGDARALGRLAAAEARHAVAPDPVRRLAALALRSAGDVARLHGRLRLSNAEAGRLAALAVPLPAELSAAAARALIYREGAAALIDRALLAEARVLRLAGGVCCGAGPVAAGWVAEAKGWAVPRFPLAAADLMRRGLQPGPELGAALAQAEADWIAADFPDDPTRLAGLADAAVAGSARG